MHNLERFGAMKFFINSMYSDEHSAHSAKSFFFFGWAHRLIGKDWTAWMCQNFPTTFHGMPCVLSSTFRQSNHLAGKKNILGGSTLLRLLSADDAIALGIIQFFSGVYDSMDPFQPGEAILCCVHLIKFTLCMMWRMNELTSYTKIQLEVRIKRHAQIHRQRRDQFNLCSTHL